MNIAKASTSQLEQIALLESECFPDESYPRFFFTQAREIYSETLLVATDDDENVIGYIMAAPDSITPSHWWILSMAVAPNHRRKKVGTSLLKEMLNTLEKLGADTVYLSVSEKNSGACALYQSFGFEITRRREDYFGENEDRLILKKVLTLSSPFALNPERLLSEVSISVSFSSVVFAVSTAILALIAPRQDVDEFVAPIVLVALAMFASFYSVLFYANASGSLTRIHDYLSVTKPLRYGNSVSEYLGVFPLVCAFPLLIYYVTDELSITIPVAIVNYIGFFLYQISDFDLLSRIMPNRRKHFMATCILILLMIGVLVTSILCSDLVSYLSLSLFLVVLISFVIVGIRNPETPIV